MDIWATHDGKFMVGLGMAGRFFDSKWNKDRTLSVWSVEKDWTVNVSTNRGTFIEVVNKRGDVVATGGDGQWFHVHLTKEPVKLRHKKLPTIKLSAAQIDKQRKTVTRYLCSDSPYELKIPDTLPGAIKWMQTKLNEIPKASRAKAEFEFGTEYSYGDSCPNIKITYTEKETDEEVIERLQIDAERDRIREETERAKLAKLKSKYEAA